MSSVDAEVVAYVAEVAMALKPLRAKNTWFGGVYISRVTFAHDGQNFDIAIVQGEYDALEVEIK